MTREIALLVTGIVIGVGVGLFQGSSWVRSKWDKEKLTQQSTIIEQQDRIKELERLHALKEHEIIVTFNEVKENYENTIHSITSDYSDSLLKHEERADYYRQKYQQCDTAGATDRIIRLDKALTEGVTLVEELEELVKFKEWQIKLNGQLIDNDRYLINN